VSPRRLLNSMLGHFGYRIVKIRKFDLFFEKLLAMHRRFKFVQIGANDGIQFDDLFFKVTSNRLPGLVVEPISDLFQILKLNYRAYPEVIPVQCALHRTETTAPIYRVRPDALAKYPSWVAGIASFNPEHYKKANVAPDDIEVEVVPCMHLMQLLSTYDMLDTALLQIDTEGYDAEIIQMIDFNKFRPLLVKFEHAHISEEQRKAIYARLLQHDYRLYPEGGDTVAAHRGLR
jgi:FkbM family methyltransferase